MYAEVNRVLGKIIKVTPSSKVVGDLALFLVQNKLNADNLTDEICCDKIDFPDSIVDFFSGGLGVPHIGFDDRIIRAVCKIKDDATL